MTRFLFVNVIWDPGYYGTYGLSVDHWSDLSVQRVVPGSPASAAGIKVGDKVELPSSLHDRLVLFRLAPRPGERVTLSVVRPGQSRTLTLQARPLAPLPASDRVLLALKVAWLFVFVTVSFVLVLLRPNKMTWGFFFFPLNLTIMLLASDLFFSYLPASLLVVMRTVELIIAPAGILGFFIFAIRFPANAPVGWRTTLESLAPLLYVAIAVPLAYWDLVNIAIPPIAALPYAFGAIAIPSFAAGAIVLKAGYARADQTERRSIPWIGAALAFGIAAAAIGLFKQTLHTGPMHWTCQATLTIGTVAVLATYWAARGLERHRIKWVVFGLVCAWIANGADHLGMSFGSMADAKWPVGVLESLYVVLPITVTYAVIRHRVIDVRFVLNRSLTFGAIATLTVVVFAGIDWLFSTRLPNSRLEMVTYAGAAVFMGFSLDAARHWIGKIVDFVLFRPWYRVQQQARALEDVVRRATSPLDLFEPLTVGVAKTFSLASVALFERVEEGGFVRAAACGWPPGTVWHVLPGDPLLERLPDNARVVALDGPPWRERDVPAGASRPVIAVPIHTAKVTQALVLCGAHESGAGLASEEVRVIRSLCACAGPVYARMQAARAARRAVAERRPQPLGV